MDEEKQGQAHLEASLEMRLAGVRAEITEAARVSGRKPEDITLIAVTKFHPLSLIDELVALGVRDFGENRHPEARDKANHLHEHHAGARLHFIGQLQRNKARQVGRYADCIQSIDRSELVEALAKLERDPADPLDVAIQLSLDGDITRGGVPLDQIEALAEEIAATPTIRLCGVMAVAPIGADTDDAFAKTRDVSELVRQIVPSATMISAGMSHDFRSAISQGATHLRIGAAITGKRPDRP